MTRINLLPWREAHRLETNREFYVVLCLCMTLAGAVGFGGYRFAEDKVVFQQQRNSLLETEIALLQEELKEIKELEQTKNNLLARMEIIQQLQGLRPQIVHTLHEVARRIPDGVFLTAMKQGDQSHMTLEGRAESNARVSALMRQMDRSDYFSEPRLQIIESDQDDRISTFKLTIQQDIPNSEKESSDGI